MCGRTDMCMLFLIISCGTLKNPWHCSKRVGRGVAGVMVYLIRAVVLDPEKPQGGVVNYIYIYICGNKKKQQLLSLQLPLKC